MLAVGAHPDDIERGCGASLLAHTVAGDVVTMLMLTGGESGPGAANRHTEQRNAARILGANLRWGGPVFSVDAARSATAPASPSRWWLEVCSVSSSCAG